MRSSLDFLSVQYTLSFFQLNHNGIFKDILAHIHTQTQIVFQYHYYFFLVLWTCTHYQSSDRDVAGGEMLTLILFSGNASGSAAVKKRLKDGMLWYGQTPSIHAAAAEKASLAAGISSVLRIDKERQGMLTQRCEVPVSVASLIGRGSSPLWSATMLTEGKRGVTDSAELSEHINVGARRQSATQQQTLQIAHVTLSQTLVRPKHNRRPRTRCKVSLPFTISYTKLVYLSFCTFWFLGTLTWYVRKGFLIDLDEQYIL